MSFGIIFVTLPRLVRLALAYDIITRPNTRKRTVLEKAKPTLDCLRLILGKKEAESASMRKSHSMLFGFPALRLSVIVSKDDEPCSNKVCLDLLRRRFVQLPVCIPVFERNCFQKGRVVSITETLRFCNARTDCPRLRCFRRASSSASTKLSRDIKVFYGFSHFSPYADDRLRKSRTKADVPVMRDEGDSDADLSDGILEQSRRKIFF